MDDELDESVASMSGVLSLITDPLLHKRMPLLSGDRLKHYGMKESHAPAYPQTDQKENVYI